MMNHAERGPILVTETIDPGSATSEQINNWYRQTYINDISKIEGWRRTSRFEGSRQPKWFALHEFEYGSFGNSTKISGLLGNSTGNSNVGKLIKKADLALWKLMTLYGNSTTGWGQEGGDKIIGS